MGLARDGVPQWITQHYQESLDTAYRAYADAEARAQARRDEAAVRARRPWGRMRKHMRRLLAAWEGQVRRLKWVMHDVFFDCHQECASRREEHGTP